MEALQYKIIVTPDQYASYCNILEQLVFSGEADANTKDTIGLLTLLIEKWDAEQLDLLELDPIQLLRSFMDEHNLKSKHLVDLLDISKGYVSDILHYKKGLSKEVIRKLSNYFKVSQDAFNRPYKLTVSENSHFRNASVMNTRKELEVA